MYVPVQYIVDYSNTPEARLKKNYQQYCLYLKPADTDYSSSFEIQENRGFFPEKLYIFVEAFHEKYKEVYEFLIKIAEPVNKPNFIHVYKITLFSMYTAMSLNLNAEKIIESLMQYSKNEVIPKSFIEFIENKTKKAGSAYLYIIKKNYYLKIHQDFLEKIIRGTLQNIIEMEQNPPQQLLQTQEESRVWNFKFYRIKQKHNLFQITEKIIKEGISLINEYHDDKESQNDLSSNAQIPYKMLDIKLKQTTQPRIYQQKALKNIFVCEKPRSATIVLPCGAGKTLLGIILTERIKGNTIVICDIYTATNQWKNEFTKWTTVEDDTIKIYTGKTKNLQVEQTKPFILITTFKQLSSIIKSNKLQKEKRQYMDKSSELETNMNHYIQKEMEWDLCIVDETQYSAASTYKKIFEEFNFKLKIGLTATPYRTEKIIKQMIFSTLLVQNFMKRIYQSQFRTAIQLSHIVLYFVVKCMNDFMKDRKFKNKPSLQSGNPQKFKLLYYLIKFHESRNDKILVFCDQIPVLKYYSQKMGYPAIYGEVDLLEKLGWLDLFREGEINTLFLSRVGDTALDLPIANVCIQIGFQFGSRRQEVQRLGRIMRRKEGQKGEYNAFFYTIVSKNTEQAQFYYRRQKSLMDLGINFEVIDIDEQNDNKFKYDPDILDKKIIRASDEIIKDVKKDAWFLIQDEPDKKVDEQDDD
ncbi:DNA repair helicase rad25 (macronuclear) [Tetrahymena thermophila SB210]|uniref:DNA 3'-5' helicase n=1 Tax=Tetrahymena thermophila (strain SB210) TaxID=312017 RepID=Q23HA3_TETTS|nr:DNA repair helicase rad25 [Tetrahymena thermophila SB210]EAR95905.2 DNA repair helicase rad25 [Tetrahymena thermophila SB210]|eukprot:XP_001016150.2 DNA repair helicase rad25 [Tetrahymena thermophila SB210]